jgi:enolase
LKAIENIEKIIAPALIGKDVGQQGEIDRLMISLDNSGNKSKLGANAILAVSIAVCRAGAVAQGLPLWQYVSLLAGRPAAGDSQPDLPWPCFLMIEGGLHAGNQLGAQEFMVAPPGESFAERLRKGAEIYQNLAALLEKKYGRAAVNVGLEGGLAAPLAETEQALALVEQACLRAGCEDRARIAVDMAASELYQDGRYQFDNASFTTEELLDFYLERLERYPFLAIEDPFAETDWPGWSKLMSALEERNSKTFLAGDDLLATNSRRIKEAVEKKACDGLILKANQVGTVTETIEAAELAFGAGWQVFVKHRSGETNDDFIADLATGLGAPWIMAGALARGERLAKYNRLLRIEEKWR